MIPRRCISPLPSEDEMGSGVARQCSRNRCLARWIVPIPIVAVEPSKLIELEERAGHGTDPRFLCPTAMGFGVAR